MGSLSEDMARLIYTNFPGEREKWSALPREEKEKYRELADKVYNWMATQAGLESDKIPDGKIIVSKHFRRKPTEIHRKKARLADHGIELSGSPEVKTNRSHYFRQQAR